jgi:hypothetical protein
MRASARLPLAALSLAPPAAPLPWLRPAGPADASPAEEEKTTVHRAVRDPGGIRHTTSAAPVRLGPKRALLAAMATVVLLLQLWMFSLARSHKEGSASPAESERSSEQWPGAASPRGYERVETAPRPPEEVTAEPLRASEQ